MVETEIQMRFADVDRLGHVNNVNLMHYYDLGKNVYFEKTIGVKVGFQKLGLITAATNCSYIDQVKPGEKIVVRSRISKIGTKSFQVSQQIFNSETNTLKSESVATMVVFDFIAQQSIELPAAWREIFEAELMGAAAQK